MYTAGLDCSEGSDGEYSLLWSEPYLQIHYHVATMMPTGMLGFPKEDISRPEHSLQSISVEGSRESSGDATDESDMDITRTRLLGISLNRKWPHLRKRCW